MEILPNHLGFRSYSARLKIDLLFCFAKFPDLELDPASPRRRETRADTRPRCNSRDFTEFSILTNRGTTADYGNYDAENLNTGPYGQ